MSKNCRRKRPELITIEIKKLSHYSDLECRAGDAFNLSHLYSTECEQKLSEGSEIHPDFIRGESLDAGEVENRSEEVRGLADEKGESQAQQHDGISTHKTIKETPAGKGG